MLTTDGSCQHAAARISNSGLIHRHGKCRFGIQPGLSTAIHAKTGGIELAQSYLSGDVEGVRSLSDKLKKVSTNAFFEDKHLEIIRMFLRADDASRSLEWKSI